ncbi:glycosyltransferase [Janibacter sp. UYMM211]|uniref:glycosyltransferase family 2 protein n=1 Tax=Janibacter sp. UYMM211 TaxID=3156342 RepID=UPI003396FE19
MTPDIGVVVPYYDDQRGLDLLLAALDQQGCAGRFEVVVADDGSPVAPTVGEHPFAVRVVRQVDAGFRAAAARNLGAAHTDAPVLCFLDGDTLPTPGYLGALAAVVAAGDERGVLAVGRRRHAELSGHAPEDVVRWLAGGPVDVTTLPDPQWLTRGYAETDDLASADAGGFRLVISAVLACDAELFARVGGFDEDFVGYGGEDWELGHRAWLAGAALRHVPGAVAWHDGPDAGGRAPDHLAKTVETLRVASRVAAPGARHPGLVWPHPAVSVELDDTGCDPAAVLACCADLLAVPDVRVHLRSGECTTTPGWPISDPRVVMGPEPAATAARRAWHVQVTRPVLLDLDVHALCARGEAAYDDALVVTETRSRALGLPPPPARSGAGVLRDLPTRVSLEGLWGWGDPSAP